MRRRPECQVTSGHCHDNNHHLLYGVQNLSSGCRTLPAPGRRQIWPMASGWPACADRRRRRRPSARTGAGARQYIGIDDGKPGREPSLVSSEAEQAGEFEELFRAVYLTFHRRDGPRSQLPAASAAVLEHLALAGPLTIGEAAAHLRRAQSVVSEIVTHLERQGLLERESDPADRRRTLIWLTVAGHTALRRHREVLSEDLLAAGLSQLDPDQVAALLDGLRALVQSAAPRRCQRTSEGGHHEHDGRL